MSSSDLHKILLIPLKEIIGDLDMVQRELGCADASARIVSKLKNSMSDRHAAETVQSNADKIPC